MRAPTSLLNPTLEERIASKLGRSVDRICEYGPADLLRDERIARERLYGPGSPSRRGRVGVKGRA